MIYRILWFSGETKLLDIAIVFTLMMITIINQRIGVIKRVRLKRNTNAKIRFDEL